MKLATKQEVRGMELIHYGSREYREELFRPVINRVWNKPYGGLWTSPVNSTYGWKDWCKSENFNVGALSTSFSFRIEEAKICKIDSYEDLIKVPMQDLTGDLLYTRQYPDFEEMIRKGIQAIWLTKEGQRRTRFSSLLGRNQVRIDLYGWDCETVLVMDKNIIKL